MTIEADAVDSGWIRIGTVTSDPLQMRESIFVNSMTESSDDTRDFRLSIHVAHDNLLVTVHILISLSLSLSLSLSPFTHATDACASYASLPFSFCVSEYSEQPVGSYNKSNASTGKFAPDAT